MARRKTTRKATYKKIGGAKVRTNPKFTTDADTLMPNIAAWGNWLDEFFRLRRNLFEASIAIGRARATASGHKRAKR